MEPFKTERFDGHLIAYRDGLVAPSLVMEGLSEPLSALRKGRGEIKTFTAGGKLFACRKYVHGGLLRAVTGDVFFSDKRASDELTVMAYLEEKGFPVVRPYGYISDNRCCAKSLHFVTFFQENRGDLLDFLKKASGKERLRAIRDLARLMSELGRLGVYHPDLHLQNVLVTEEGRLVFLDFDKAQRTSVSRENMMRMLWRLNRFAQKKEKSGELLTTLQEKTLFLRVFERSSGYRVMEEMQRQLGNKRRASKLGWTLERIFYGRGKPD
jgi:RIO-like serine/threonine protein kinase